MDETALLSVSPSVSRHFRAPLEKGRFKVYVDRHSIAHGSSERAIPGSQEFERFSNLLALAIEKYVAMNMDAQMLKNAGDKDAHF